MSERYSRRKLGAFSDIWLADLITAGFLPGADEDNINPASLDLSLSEEIYQVYEIFQPKPGETVRGLLEVVKHHRHDLSRPLKRNEIYLARLNEKSDLPAGIYGYLNPKSSTGRNDVHVRVLTDKVSRYDTLPAGIGGVELWIIINPRSFNVRFSSGQTLSQLRLFNLDTRFNETELQVNMAKESLLWSRAGQPFRYQDLSITDRDGSLILTLDLESDIIGYECLDGVEGVIDFSRVGGSRVEDFWRPITKDDMVDGRIRLKQGRFYLLSTAEAVRVPDRLACEMVPMDERSGEFRSHYAGFIDPGWGQGEDGEGRGRPLTLEIRPFEDLIIRPGQPIAKVKFEYMADIPRFGYDALTGSNYLTQTRVGLAKQFKA